MAAELMPAPGGCSGHLLRLPPPETAGDLLEEVRYGLATAEALRGPLTLESGAWALHTGELRQLTALLGQGGLQLVAVRAACATTLVAAAALGLETNPLQEAAAPPAEGGELLVHHGTLRSGDHLQAAGSVLLLGDVNPGARISAGGHVLVWGRLRGIAHAGQRGDGAARIVALQLQPLQLRIAEAVARGPQERPPLGLAEEARLVEGEIRIEPAPAHWPLSG